MIEDNVQGDTSRCQSRKNMIENTIISIYIFIYLFIYYGELTNKLNFLMLNKIFNCVKNK